MENMQQQWKLSDFTSDKYLNKGKIGVFVSIIIQGYLLSH